MGKTGIFGPISVRIRESQAFPYPPWSLRCRRKTDRVGAMSQGPASPPPGQRRVLGAPSPLLGPDESPAGTGAREIRRSSHSQFPTNSTVPAAEKANHLPLFRHQEVTISQSPRDAKRAPSLPSSPLLPNHCAKGETEARGQVGTCAGPR